MGIIYSVHYYIMYCSADPPSCNQSINRPCIPLIMFYFSTNSKCDFCHEFHWMQTVITTV